MQFGDVHFFVSFSSKFNQIKCKILFSQFESSDLVRLFSFSIWFPVYAFCCVSKACAVCDIRFCTKNIKWLLLHYTNNNHSPSTYFYSTIDSIQDADRLFLLCKIIVQAKIQGKSGWRTWRQPLEKMSSRRDGFLVKSLCFFHFTQWMVLNCQS